MTGRNPHGRFPEMIQDCPHCKGIGKIEISEEDLAARTWQQETLSHISSLIQEGKFKELREIFKTYASHPDDAKSEFVLETMARDGLAGHDGKRWIPIGKLEKA